MGEISVLLPAYHNKKIVILLHDKQEVIFYQNLYRLQTLAHYYSRVWDPLTLQAYCISVGGTSLADTESISAILFGS